MLNIEHKHTFEEVLPMAENFCGVCEELGTLIGDAIDVDMLQRDNVLLRIST